MCPALRLLTVGSTVLLSTAVQAQSYTATLLPEAPDLLADYPELAAELAARGVVYLDATVSGSSAQVRDGIAALLEDARARRMPLASEPLRSALPAQPPHVPR